ncbi:MAG: hypothetical protein J7J52_04870 [Deltaproteobacteria bacterium]|nr:hypothetical protein [Deltaproteobacteria bacterium]
MLIKFDIRFKDVVRRNFVIDTSKNVSTISDPKKDITIYNISVEPDWNDYIYSVDGTSERFRWRRKEVL